MDDKFYSISSEVHMEHPINLTYFLPHIFEQYWYVTMSALFLLVLTLFLLWTKSKLNMKSPGKVQALLEIVYTYIKNTSREILGEEGAKYFPFCVGIGIYVLIGNIGDLIPFLVAPTASLTVVAPPAILVFLLYNFIGIRKFGLGYFKRFFGDILWLAPFMFVLEIISHVVRPLTLSVRLYGNVLGGSILLLIALALMPIGAPIVVYLFESMKVLLQAYIFMLLSMIYIGTALEDNH